MSTPAIDAMAQRGVLYRNAFSTAPVCAPSQFALVTGMYAAMCSPAHDMRANGALGANNRPLPLHMRNAGYYCTNNAITDYNMVGDQQALWDQCDVNAHWRNRPPGKPLFCVYNYAITHESHVFGTFELRTDPAKVSIPPFLPDEPAVRSVLARNIDMVNDQDLALAYILGELQKDGLVDDTFVFFLADHGGVHPRSKRYCFDDGLHVPLIVQVPKNFAHLAQDAAGHVSDRVVSHIDMAPTALALAGVPTPQNMVGVRFMGQGKVQPRNYAFSMRDRMDERYDLMYSVRDERYRYTRYYAPQRAFAQHEAYEWQSVAYQAWEQGHIAGELDDVQSQFWKPKSVEQLFDAQVDPHSVHNLMDEPAHRARIAEMRKALDELLVSINDNGFIPEGISIQGYDASRIPGAYPLPEILKIASLGLQRDPKNIPGFIQGLQSDNECVRFWSAQGLVLITGLTTGTVHNIEQRLSSESSVVVRCALAEALVATKQRDAGRLALVDIATNQSNVRFQLRALNVLTLIPAAELKVHRSLFEKLTESKDEYVPEDARYILFNVDGMYEPTSKVFGGAQPKSVLVVPLAGTQRNGNAFGDPQI